MVPRHHRHCLIHLRLLIQNVRFLIGIPFFYFIRLISQFNRVISIIFLFFLKNQSLPWFQLYLFAGYLIVLRLFHDFYQCARRSIIWLCFFYFVSIYNSKHNIVSLITFILFSELLFFQMLINPSFHFLYHLLTDRFHRLHNAAHASICFDRNLMWKPRIGNLLNPRPQTCADGDNQKHTRWQNTDIRKTDRILLHAVQHARNACKMACLVIVILVFLQNFQKCNTSSRKQAVRSHHNQGDCIKKLIKCVHRGLAGQSQIIANTKKHESKNRRQKLRFRFPLTLRAAVQQFDRLWDVDLAKA